MVQALGQQQDGPLQRHLVLEQMPPPWDRRQYFIRRAELEGEDLPRFRVCTVDAGRPRNHLLLFLRKEEGTVALEPAGVGAAGVPRSRGRGVLGEKLELSRRHTAERGASGVARAAESTARLRFRRWPSAPVCLDSCGSEPGRSETGQDAGSPAEVTVESRCHTAEISTLGLPGPLPWPPSQGLALQVGDSVVPLLPVSVVF